MKDSSSITAEGVALIRAIESRRPEGERICYDPCAKRFVRPWISAILGLVIKTGIAERKAPGAMAFHVARARYIDDYLLYCIREGLQQLVILGAGFDSRAYRFSPLDGPVKVFEVDHPATQKVKLERLRKIYGKRPANVTYVPVDFDHGSLANGLYCRGYDNKLKTLFIWEGVTFYLTAQAVDDTLSFITKNSSPGSSVIFDYTYTSVINGTYYRPEVGSMMRSSKYTGEGLVFGVEEGQIGEFLDSRGFNRVVNVTGDDLQKMYFQGANAKRKVAPVYCIVHAAVKPKGH